MRRGVLLAPLLWLGMLASGSVAQAQAPAFASVPGSPFSVNGPAVGGRPHSVGFSPGGGLLATANYLGNNVSLFDVVGGTLQQVPGSPFSVNGPAVSGLPYSVAFSPGGGLLATANSLGNNVSLFDVVGRKLEPVVGSPFSTGSYYSASVAFSPVGALVATANAFGNSVSLFDVADGRLEPVVGSPFSTSGPGGSGRFPISVAFSSDGTMLATANGFSQDVSLFNVADGRLEQVAGSPFSTSGSGSGSAPVSVAFSPSGRLLAAANANTNNVSLFDVADGKLEPVMGSPFPTEGPAGSGNFPVSVAFSPDGALLATANDSSDNVSVFDVVGRKLEPVAGSPFSTNGPAGSGSAPFSVAFSPGGGLVASANFDTDNVSLFAPTGPFQITTVASPGRVRPGGAVSYSLRVRNPGAKTVVGAVSDDLSGVLKYATYLNDAIASPGSVVAFNPSTSALKWEGALAAGATARITYSVRVHDGLHGGLLYSAAVGPPGSSCTGRDPALPCMTRTPIVPEHTSEPTTLPDLELTKSASTPTVHPGGQVTFTLMVHNRGPGRATGVTIEDPGPPGIFLQHAQASPPGSCTITSELRCTLGELPSGGSAVVLVTATVRTDASGSIENVATVWCNLSDLNEANNTARSTIHVAPLPPPPPASLPSQATVAAGVQPVSDLHLEHHGPSGRVLAGQHHTFTTVLTNRGPDPARDVLITFTSNLPLQIIAAHAAHASAVHEGCTRTVPVRCEVGKVPVGGRVTLGIVAAVPRLFGVLRTAAAVMSASWDPYPKTSFASAETRISRARVHRPVPPPMRPPAVTG